MSRDMNITWLDIDLGYEFFIKPCIAALGRSWRRIILIDAEDLYISK